MASEVTIDLNPETIIGYLVSSKNYVEAADDKRRRPTFYWKAYHLYPFAVMYPDPESTYDDGTPVYDENDFDEDGELANPMLIVCTEGGTPDVFNHIPMKALDLREFVRDHPSFRLQDADELFTELKFV